MKVMTQIIQGDRVSYEDMANPRKEGTIVGTKLGTRFSSPQFQIRWDDGSEDWSDLLQHGWEKLEDAATR